MWLLPHRLIGCEVLGVVIKDTDIKWAFFFLSDYYLLPGQLWMASLWHYPSGPFEYEYAKKWEKQIKYTL